MFNLFLVQKWHVISTLLACGFYWWWTLHSVCHCILRLSSISTCLSLLIPSGQHLKSLTLCELEIQISSPPLQALRELPPHLPPACRATYLKMCIVCVQYLSIFPQTTQWLPLSGCSSNQSYLLIAWYNGKFSVFISFLTYCFLVYTLHWIFSFIRHLCLATST